MYIASIFIRVTPRKSTNSLNPVGLWHPYLGNIMGLLKVAEDKRLLKVTEDKVEGVSPQQY